MSAAWVELADLPGRVRETVGEADAAAGLEAVKTAIDGGQVLVRWSPNLARWRFRQREMNVELQHAMGAQAGGLLAPPGHPPGPAFKIDVAEGIALAPGDPAGRKPLRSGLWWPVGPVEINWPQAAAALAKATRGAA